MYLQSGSSRDDLDELLGDNRLSGTVEGEGQLVNHLSWNERKTSITSKYKTLLWKSEILKHNSVLNTRFKQAGQDVKSHDRDNI